MFQGIDLLQSAMGVSSLTNQVIANNIANADTPNFKASYVAAQVQSNPERVEGQVITDTSTSISNDGNNVDINQQMALLAENTIKYETLTLLTSMSFKRYSDVLTNV
jgi:flagellar basal-body rod protein FlgB|uniref:Flagellar basal body rod protein FlgB n=1 Tax=Mesoaciditoga lauensis TaxID=1495039 RepID=A0A7V3VSU5_9BACT